MAIFINTHTMQYPLFEGDAKLDNAFWEIGWPLPEFWEYVVPIDTPKCNADEVVEQTLPELIDGQWKMKWVIRPKTEQELAEPIIENPFQFQN